MIAGRRVVVAALLASGAAQQRPARRSLRIKCAGANPPAWCPPGEYDGVAPKAATQKRRPGARGPAARSRPTPPQPLYAAPYAYASNASAASAWIRTVDGAASREFCADPPPREHARPSGDVTRWSWLYSVLQEDATSSPTLQTRS